MSACVGTAAIIGRSGRLDPRLARQALTVVGERLVYELQGVACISLDLEPPPRRTIAVTRSFGEAVLTWEPMREAVAAYATRAGEKLRKEHLAAECIQVFMHTSPFRHGPTYSNAVTVELQPPTDDTFALIATATLGARRIWRDGYAMSKAGVLLSGLVPVGKVQPDLLQAADRQCGARLMAALDAVNHRMGRDTLVPAATMGRAWKMRQESKSPSYTTKLADVPLVRT